MPSENKLKQVGTERYVDAEPVAKRPALLDEAAAAMLLLAIKSLSQRALVALSSLFTLLTCASAFILWQDVLPNPNAYQLTGLGLYGAFILLLHLVRGRHGVHPG